MKAPYTTNFGPCIAEYWREHWPDQARTLAANDRLVGLADRAADEAAKGIVDGMKKYGLTFEKAYEVAAVNWQKPPLNVRTKEAG